MYLYKSIKKILILKNSRRLGLMDSKDLCRALAALLQFLDGQSTDAQRCALVPFLCVKKQRPIMGPRVLVKFPRVGRAIEVKCPTCAWVSP